MTTPDLPAISRRQALSGFAGAAIVAPFASPTLAQTAQQPALTLISNSICSLTPQSAEGPYYFDPALERADIRGDRAGVPLRLAFQVVSAADCRPLPGARVDIWHADATGHYSGYPRQGDGRDATTEGQAFLRGTQFADDSGLVTFQSIYPGWYPGRTVHVHFKIFLDERTILTGQGYFPDTLSEPLFASNAPYNTRTRQRAPMNEEDRLLAASGAGPENFFAIEQETDGYRAVMVVGANALP